MSHHGSDPFDNPEKSEKFAEFKKELLNTTGFRGALGTFPDGELTKTDEGAIQFGITHVKGKVVLDFGTPTAWVGMTPQQAADLATILIKNAKEASRQTGQPLTVTIA